MAEIITAEKSGFCYGVRRAVELLNRMIAKYGESRNIFLIGEIIHNRVFTGEILNNKNVSLIDGAEIDRLAALDCGMLKNEVRAKFPPESVIVIRAHGVQKNLLRAFYEAGCEVADATCGDIKKIYRLLEENCRPGTLAIITGSAEHPEIKGLCSYAGCEIRVYGSADALVSDFENLAELAVRFEKIICLSQTTHSQEDFERVSGLLLADRRTARTEIYRTICPVTGLRQSEAERMSRICGVMIVAGGPHSSNTRKIFDICKKNCEDSFMIETSEQLPLYRLKKAISGNKALKVGITAGASTPDGVIMRIIKEVEKLI